MSARNSAPSRLKGVWGKKTRTALNALYWESIPVQAIAQALDAPTEHARALIKHLVERGFAERIRRGVYQITPAGRAVLSPVRQPAEKPVTLPARRPKLGWRWTPKRDAWLIRYYPVLGPHRCGDLLMRDWTVVHAQATRLGLKWGDVEGYTLLADAARLLNLKYAGLYTRAKRASVLTFPKAVMQGRRRKALVPDWWVEWVMAERALPEQEEVALADLRAELGLSKTQAQRLAGPDAVLRVPEGGGQARLYVTDAVADRIRAHERSKRPRAATVGQHGVRAALARAGAAGLTEHELVAVLGCNGGPVRSHTQTLLKTGELERCRLGGPYDPFIYRLVQYQGQPQPACRVNSQLSALKRAM